MNKQQHQAGMVAQRYTSDVMAIHRQIDFQRRKSSIFVNEISEHNKTLLAFGLQPLPTRNALGLPPHELTGPEVQSLIPHVQKLLPQIDRLQAAYIERVAEFAESDHRWLDFEIEEQLGHEEYAKANVLVDKWTQYFRSFSDEQLLDQPEDFLIEKANRTEKHSSTVDAFAPDLDWCIQHAVRDAKMDRLNEKASLLYELHSRFEEFSIIAESGESPVAVLRQAFIAMMASFDAAIIDLIRIALQDDFFRIAFLGDKKISIDGDDISSWEQLRESLIEKQLRKHYAVGWLHLLNSKLKVFGAHSATHFNFPRVVEQVNRRNVHLHNRGIVDDNYAKQQYNLDNLEIRTLALITETYWDRAHKINEKLVRRIAQWAAQLPQRSLKN